MSTKSSTVPVIAWNWVIQALTKFKQVDSSTLVGLVKKAPAISDDLGKDAREMLSLRILESLFINESDEATVDTNSTENAKISFDPSENCEDVLQKILEETSEPLTKLEQQKWNVYPFIMHKTSSLPKSSFQKFKEALLEGSHPLFSTLKERSKVGAANVSENTSYTADVNFDAQTTVAEYDLASPNPANENNKLQESVLQNSNELDNFTKGLEFGGESRDRKNDTLPNVSNSEPSGEEKKSSEKGNQVEIGSDSERSDDERTDSESDDERTDIAAKKEAFLSSQCTLSQDTMAMNEICLCMRCNKGGQLLVCRSNACEFRVHESCMGSAATLDENGKFYCPFCAYSRSISMYLLVKKKASLARKDLQAFLSLGVEHRQKISSKRGAGLETNESRQIGASGENFVVNGNEDTVTRGKEDCPPIKSSCVSNAENQMLAEPSRLCVNNVLDCGDKGVSVGIGSLTKRVEMEKKGGEVSESLTRMEALNIGENAAIHSDNGYLNQPTTDSLHQPLHQPRMRKAEYNEKESPASDVSNHSRRSCKRKSPYTSPPIPLLGRKKLQWTKSEEDILKEGVQKFWSVDNKRIPWREILSFGEGVFHKSRTAIDLKDKWRNICKGSPAAKKPKL